MDERDVAQLFIAEMRALLPVVQRHLDTLSGAFTSDAQRQVAAHEVCRLATAMADLSSGFHADDCAFLAAAIATAYEDDHAARLPSMALLAATTDILTYMHARMQLMAEHSRVVATDEAERVATNRLLTALRDAQQRITHVLPERPAYSSRDTRPLDAIHPSLSAPDAPDRVPHESVAPSGVQFTPTVAPEPLSALADELGQVSNDTHPWHASSNGAMHDAQSFSQLTEDDNALLEVFRQSELRVARAPIVTGPLPELHTTDTPEATPSTSHTTPDAREETWATPAASDSTPVGSSDDNEHVVDDVSFASSFASSFGPRPAIATSSQSAAYPLTASDLDAIPPEMHRIFVTETTADIQDLRRALLRYEGDGDEGVLGEMGRIAHKVKGNAATLNYLVFADLTLVFEDILTAFPRQSSTPQPEAASALVQGIDLLQSALDAVIAEQKVDSTLVQRANLLRDMLQVHTEDPADSHSVRTSPSAFMPPMAVGATTSEAQQGSAARQIQASSDDREPLLRVDVHRLNDLIKHVSALALNRAALTQAGKEIDRLQDELEHSLARLSLLSGDISDLYGLLTHMASTQKGGEVKDATQSSPGRFGLNIFGLAGKSPQQNPPGPASSSDVMQTTPSHSFGSLTLGNTFTSPVQRHESPAFDLERYTEVDHALRSLNEVVADVTTTSRTLRGLLTRLSQVSHEQAALAGDMQHDVMRIRLVPLGELIPRLHFEVRRVQQVASKKIVFTTSGEQTEIDRNISEALSEPLIQLIRNAILHGIESPHERVEQGKPEMGSVWLHAYYTNSDVIIEVGDDGRGVNPFGLAGVAFTKGYIDADSARNMSYTEALDLMFLPGVSTFDEAQTLGGRGIGLDQVRTAIQQLKGTISVRSEQGKGSVFRVRVPISLSIVRSLHVRAGDQQFAIPFTSVQRTLSLSPGDILVSMPAQQPPAHARANDSAWTAQPSAQRHVRIDRVKTPRQSDRQHAAAETDYEEIPAFVLTDLLGFEQDPQDSQMALVIDLGRQRAALLINDVVTEQELVVQVLPKHLRRRSLRGASVTPDGQLLLLLDVHELVTAALDGSRPRTVAPIRSAPPRPPMLAPRVLVVDDSVSIRGTLERVLTRAGFDVQVARDGIEALEAMLASPPPVMVLDIEMPRLDGFELLSIVRGSHQFDGIRVVMLTSRAADIHRAHALSLGAEAYLIKPCPNDILVETIRSLLMEPVITR